MYRVTRRFTSGPFAGLTITQLGTVRMSVTGREVKPCAGASRYVILSCEAVA